MLATRSATRALAGRGERRPPGGPRRAMVLHRPRRGREVRCGRRRAGGHRGRPALDKNAPQRGRRSQVAHRAGRLSVHDDPGRKAAGTERRAEPARAVRRIRLPSAGGRCRVSSPPRSSSGSTAGRSSCTIAWMGISGCPWRSAADGTRRCWPTCPWSAGKTGWWWRRQRPAAIVVQRGPRVVRLDTRALGDDRERFSPRRTSPAGRNRLPLVRFQRLAGSAATVTLGWNAVRWRKRSNGSARGEAIRSPPRPPDWGRHGGLGKLAGSVRDAAELQAGLRRSDSTAAAVENLHAARPAEYPAPGFLARVADLRSVLLDGASADLRGGRGADGRAVRPHRGSPPRGPGSREPAVGRQEAAAGEALHLRFQSLLRRIRRRHPPFRRRAVHAFAGRRRSARRSAAAGRRPGRPLRPLVRRAADRVRLQATAAAGLSHLRDRRRRHGPAATDRSRPPTKTGGSPPMPPVRWRPCGKTPAATGIGPTTCTPAICPTAASSSPPRGASRACSAADIAYGDQPAPHRRRRPGPPPPLAGRAERVLPHDDERRPHPLQSLGIRGQGGGGRAVAVGDVPRRQPLRGNLRQQHHHPRGVQSAPPGPRLQSPAGLPGRRSLAGQRRGHRAGRPAQEQAHRRGHDRPDPRLASQGQLGLAAVPQRPLD